MPWYVQNVKNEFIVLIRVSSAPFQQDQNSILLFSVNFKDKTLNISNDLTRKINIALHTVLYMIPGVHRRHHFGPRDPGQPLNHLTHRWRHHWPDPPGHRRRSGHLPPGPVPGHAAGAQGLWMVAALRTGALRTEEQPAPVGSVQVKGESKGLLWEKVTVIPIDSKF